jgi:type I site-specific restriction endonuclease
MLPEERAREKIDKQLTTAGWDIVSRDEYVPQSASAVKEALMLGNTESDYLLFVDDKAIAVVEAKREEKEEDKDNFIRRERSYSCARSYYVGDRVTEEYIKAKYDNGTLTLKVPKVQKEIPQKRNIAID